MIAGRICSRCDEPIYGDADEIVPDSMSGARPSSWVHKPGDPDCIPDLTGWPRL